MEKLNISKYPLLVKVILLYLFVKTADGFLNALGTVLFQNTSPLLENYFNNSIIFLSNLRQWLTNTEIKITPLVVILFIIIFYFIFRISNKFI